MFANYFFKKITIVRKTPKAETKTEHKRWLSTVFLLI